MLPRIPAIRWLAAGQLDGFTDQVMKVIDTLQLFTLFVKSTGVQLGWADLGDNAQAGWWDKSNQSQPHSAELSHHQNHPVAIMIELNPGPLEIYSGQRLDVIIWN